MRMRMSQSSKIISLWILSQDKLSSSSLRSRLSADMSPESQIKQEETRKDFSIYFGLIDKLLIQSDL